MSLASSVKLWTKFEDDLLFDEKSGNYLTLSGDPVEIVTGRHGNALQMSYGSYLETSQSLGLTTQVTFSFWLKPNNPGISLNATGGVVPLRMALFSKSGFSYSYPRYSLVNPAFIAWEETQPNSLNVLNFRVVGLSGDCTARSSSYKAGVWHHFWITYSGPDQYCRIYVDGVLGGVVHGRVPLNIQSTADPFQINYAIDTDTNAVFARRGRAPANRHNGSRNAGVLDEFMVMNQANTTTATIARVANMGVEYAFDSDYTSVEETYIGIGFNDAGTVEVGGVATTSSDILIGRNDGTVLRGHKDIWRNRRLFGTDSEKKLLTDKYGDSQVTINNGLLVPKVMIRS